MAKVTLVEWPNSQWCMDCGQGAFIDSPDERIGDSMYCCFEQSHPGLESCLRFKEQLPKPKETEEDKYER